VYRKTIPLIMATMFLLACTESVGTRDGTGSGFSFKSVFQTWVATTPIQCLRNDWEKDWLSHPGHEYGDYPRDFSRQLEIIRDYYDAQGVDVRDGTIEDWNTAVCAACTCAAGYTLYLLVPDDDVDKMLALGYRREAPVEK